MMASGVRLLAIAVIVIRRLAPAAVRTLAARVRGNPEAARRHLYAGVAATVEALGPVAIKAGQILATRRDLLPPELCAALGRLHDRGPRLPAAEARATLADVYGADLDRLFATIDWDAVASGSVACVHRARLRDGRPVAVKVLRPGTEEAMAIDLALLRSAGAIVARLPRMRGAPVRRVVEQLCDAVRAQGDLAAEARALERLGRALAPLPRVRVPRVLPAASRDRAMAMEFIPGLAAGPPVRGPAARRLAAVTLEAVYRMLFVDGFVHCDLHPGNLYVRSGGIVVLDAGFSVALPERLRRLFAEFFLHMSMGRGLRCADVVIASADGRRPDADLGVFRTAMAALVERNAGVPAREFSLIGFAAEMFDLQRRTGLLGASDLVFPLLCLLVIEGTIRALDPDMDFQAAARPVVSEALFADPAAKEAHP